MICPRCRSDCGLPRRNCCERPEHNKALICGGCFLLFYPDLNYGPVNERGLQPAPRAKSKPQIESTPGRTPLAQAKGGVAT